MVNQKYLDYLEQKFNHLKKLQQETKETSILILLEDFSGHISQCIQAIKSLIVENRNYKEIIELNEKRITEINDKFEQSKIEEFKDPFESVEINKGIRKLNRNKSKQILNEKDYSIVKENFVDLSNPKENEFEKLTPVSFRQEINEEKQNDEYLNLYNQLKSVLNPQIYTLLKNNILFLKNNKITYEQFLYYLENNSIDEKEMDNILVEIDKILEIFNQNQNLRNQKIETTNDSKKSVKKKTVLGPKREFETTLRNTSISNKSKVFKI